MANNDEDASSPTRKEKNSERENSVQPDSRNSSSSESSIALSDLASLILGSRSGENTRNRFSGNPLQDLLIQLSSDLAEGNGSAPLSSFGFHFVSNGGELEKIIKTLKDSNDSELRINSLSQLCEYLSMATEDTLLNFPLNDFLLVFIEILSEEESPEITLKAIRALCYVMEVSPSLISKIVSFSDGSVLKILGDKLLAISFIDVAEESITAFHKIANEGSFSEELLSCGCIQAMINFIDFFDSNLQIIIIEIVTSVCKGFPENHFNTLLEIMPALTQLLDSSNKIMAQKVSLCFFRLISQFNSDEEKLDVLFSAGCATTLLALLEQNSVDSLDGHSADIRLFCAQSLAILCRGSNRPKSLFLSGNSHLETLIGLLQLARHQLQSSSDVSHATYLHALLGLFNELLPGAGLLQQCPLFCQTRPREGEDIVVQGACVSYCLKEALPLAYDLFETAVSPALKVQCLLTLLKLCCLDSASSLICCSALNSATSSPDLIAFTSTLLANRQDARYIAIGLLMTHVLLSKSDSIDKFIHEGVPQEIYALKKLRFKSEWFHFLVRTNDKQQLKSTEKWVNAAAKETHATYFSNLVADCHRAALAEVVRHLSDPSSLSCALTDLKNLISSVSSFELIDSNLVPVLLRLLTTKDNEKRIGNIKKFSAVFLSTPEYGALTAKLHEVLHRTEQFPRVTLDTFIRKGSARPDRKRPLVSDQEALFHVLTAPVRVSLRPLDIDSTDKNYTMVVYADPVSSLEAIEAYILRKLEPKEAVSSSSTEEPMSIRLLSAAANGYKESADASKEKLSEPIIDSENNEELTVDFTKQEQQPQPSPRLPAKRNRKVRDSFLPLIHPRTTSVYRQSSSAPQGRVFFFFNGERLSSKDTVFKFVLKQSKHVIKSHVSLEYQHVPRDKSFPEEQITAIMDRSNFFSIFEYLGTLRCMCDLPNQIFTLLKLLYILNRDWWLFNNKLPAWRSCLSLNSFITVKLSSKLVSQLQDLPTVASCNIPTWCYEAAEKFPFLFTFESRVLFMRVTAFGGFRGLNYLAKSQYAGQSVGSTFLRSFSLKRIKIKIERERVFESFMKIVEEHFDSKTSLEIDFLNEVGSGLGPTLEFFTLCSNEFKRRDLNMWWKDTYHEPLHSSKYVTFLAGLFPKFTTDPSDKVLKYFSSLGTFCAKALADQRLVDILFSPVFWLLSIGGKDQIAQLCVASLADIDYRLFTSLKALQQIVDERKFYEKEDNIIKLAEVDQHVENMSISWSYPGHADVIMKTSNEFVSGKELEEYIFSVAHYTFFVGCTQQIQAFVSGWNKVCSIKVLQSFTPEEINTLLCGVEDQWDSETIISSIQPAHGYTFQSASVENFISIISSFDSLQRRQLLKFLTGSPRLPSGGLKSLSPPLTIVKKVVETSADDYLPSVMTCVNYLKLPDYSSKSVMQKKLLIAMYEGSESFHLS